MYIPYETYFLLLIEWGDLIVRFIFLDLMRKLSKSLSVFTFIISSVLERAHIAMMVVTFLIHPQVWQHWGVWRHSPGEESVSQWAGACSGAQEAEEGSPAEQGLRPRHDPRLHRHHLLHAPHPQAAGLSVRGRQLQLPRALRQHLQGLLPAVVHLQCGSCQPLPGKLATLYSCCPHYLLLSYMGFEIGALCFSAQQRPSRGL